MSVQGDGNPSCSCTSCFYKSESESPSVKNIIQHGTRIDKLFLDEFIPLRERKLLERLLKTRAVYDEVRTQLLSNSSSEVNEKANLRKRKHTPHARIDRNKSSALLQIVDMVDKGAVMDSKSSECCSCCICAAKSLLPRQHAGTGTGKRGRHSHRRTGSQILSKSSDTGRQRLKAGKNVKFKAKHIQSDPCTCTLGLGNTDKLSSKGRHKRSRRERSVPQMSNSRERIRKSLQKLKRSQAMINNSKTKLRKNIESSTRKSIEKLRNTRNKVKNRLDTSTRKSMQMSKKALDLPDHTEEETSFKIQKDSIIKFKEKLKRNLIMKDYECTHLCDPDECIPEVCYEKIQRKKARHRRKAGSFSKHRASMGDTSDLLSVTDSCIKCVPVDCIPGKCLPEECREKIKQMKELKEKTDSKEIAQYDKNIDATLNEKRNTSDANNQAKKAPEKKFRIGSKQLKMESKSKDMNNETNLITSSEVNIQAEGMERNVKTGTKSQKPRRSAEAKNNKKRVQKMLIKGQGIKTSANKSMSSIDKADMNITNKHSRPKHTASSTSLVHKTKSGQLRRGGEQKSGGTKRLNKVNQSKAKRSGSSRSFNTDFGNENLSNLPQPENNERKTIRKKVITKQSEHRMHQARKSSHKQSIARQLNKTRNRQAEIALKRCLCSLRFKSKKKQPQYPTLKPYECEPYVCIPSECDPIECQKRITNRYKTYSSTRTNTYNKTKSTSSITSKSSSSGTSRKLQDYSTSKERVERSPPHPESKPLREGSGQRQAVRVGSSFSFNIEFYKENPADGNIVPNETESTNVKDEKAISDNRRRTKVDRHKRRVSHKHSQISSTTGKSKYTLTKHSLRRCFCTLKLTKRDRKKETATSRSKSTGTPNQSLAQVPKMHSVSQVTPRAMNTNKKYHKAIHKLLAYECEPGICEPGECNPYECLEIIKKRNISQKKRRTVQSGTGRRRTRSTSSVTSKSATPKAKKVQSTLLAHKSQLPNQYTKKNAPREIKTSPSSPDRQAVRIGSSFSFDIEFFKEKSSPSYPSPVKTQYVQELTHADVENKKPKVKNRGLQGYVKTPLKSTSIGTDKKERNVVIGPAMKRCFCTLKLHKTGKNERVVDSVDAGTETPVFRRNTNLKVITISTGTKTKEKYKYARQLEPYECQPNVCIPGMCDPYECLERIKKRHPTSKDFGVGTYRSKTRTTASGTTKMTAKSKKIATKSKEKIRTSTKSQKTVKSVPSSEQFKTIANVHSSKSSKQAVRIGSSFSFDIEFFKDRSSLEQATPIISQDRSRRSVKSVESKTIKNVRSRGEKASKKSVGQRSSQVKGIKTKHKSTGIVPILKRCFCTLKLQKANQNKKLPNKTLVPEKNPKIYAVTQITKENQFAKRTPWITNNNNNGFSFSMPYKSKLRNVLPYSVNGIASIVSAEFKYKDMQSYFHETKQETTQFHPSHPPNSQTLLQKSVELKSKITKRIEVMTETKDYLVLKKRESVRTSYKDSEVSTKINLMSTTVSTSTLKYWESNTMKSNVPQLNPFLKRCYCTMNIQVPAKGKKRAKHRLEPYECEPGVCVPDECDPYECENRILRRLRKGVSKMSGTNITSKSISSYTPSNAKDSKGTKVQSEISPPAKENVKTPSKGIKYKTYPKPVAQEQNRQAVRVGSKFSFDIEFSKDRSQSIEVPKVVRERKQSSNSRRHKRLNSRRSKLSTKGTNGVKVKRNESASQSRLAKIDHRGTDAKPMLKRCFCTLKLQKKGKQQKERKSFADHGTATTPRKRQDVKPVPRTVDSTQNTNVVKTHRLEPYECEPNVCVPGECNPIECLELIKKRKKHTRSSATDSMIRSRKSTSSSAGQRKQLKGKQIQSVFKEKEVKSKKKVSKSRPSALSRNIRQKSFETIASRPSNRQAVRVGSSFSFNVEFYKDRSHVQESPGRYAPPSKHSRVESQDTVRRISKPVGSKTAVTDRSSQGSKLVKNRQSQFQGLVKNVKSTMTNSFLRRCFCTAKLHGINNGAMTNQQQQSNKSQTLLKRCFCTLKSLTTVKQKPRDPPSQTANVAIEAKLAPAKVERDTNTRRSHNVPRRTLDPYECEPGICIPGECDPYVCDKNIKKRNAKLQGKSSNTDGPRSKSISSSFTSTKSRHKNTQSKTKTVVTTKTVKATKKKQEPSREYVVKDIVKLPSPSPMSSNRQAVRIGSTFSFDIEFYKEKSPHYQEVQAAAQAIKKSLKPEIVSKVSKSHGTGTTKRFSSKGVMKEVKSRRDHRSQASVKSEHRGTGVGPLLKRCFCTLKLHQKVKKSQEPSKVKIKEQDIIQTAPSVTKVAAETTSKAVATNKVKAIKYKLDPYECEPGVCVPGECNPYECDKLIKKRNRRNSSTSTQQHKTKSTSSKMRSSSKYKHRNVQHSMLEKRQTRKESRVREKPPPRISFAEEPISRPQKSKQAVRLGSNFNFNVEFFKDRSYACGDTTPSIQQIRSPPVSIQKVRHVHSRSEASKNARNKRIQGGQVVRHIDSQVLAKKVQSKMTGMPPFLKRCFCTLKLHKDVNKTESKPAIKPSTTTGTQNNTQLNVKSKTKGTDRASHTKTVREDKTRHLEPYECEPGVCIPNQCDPYECEKRIKKRLMQSKMAGTGKPSGRSISSSFSASSKAKQTQANHREQRVKARHESRKIREDQKYTVQPTRDSSGSSRRQAVKIGSNFSFNVEFYKDRSLDVPQLQQKIVRSSAVEKKIKHASTAPKRKKDSAASHRGAGSHHRHSQSEGTKTESKGSSIGPLLKRCFCTLKLHKTGKHEVKQKEPLPKPQSKPGVGTSTKDIPHIQAASKDASTGVRKKVPQLEPYECEPGVCVPGQCDPFECDKLIKLRKRNLGAGTENSRMRSASTMTSRGPRSRTVKTQLHTQTKEQKQRRERSETKPTPISVKTPKSTVNETSRQAVRLGSNFSFNVEFFKDRSAQQYNVLPVYKQIISRSMPGNVKKVGQKSKSKLKTKSQGCRRRDFCSQDRKLQAAAIMSEKCSGMGPLLKRCFCTLALQNKSKQTLNKKKVVYNPQSSKERSVLKEQKKSVIKEKSTSIQKSNNLIKEKIAHNLDRYECEPEVCIPGQCDPRECEERIKKRGIRRKSRTAGTHIRKNSASSMASHLKPLSRSRRMQANFVDKSKAETSMVVEQPRFPFGNMNRQGLRFGSNISLSIEFYMETVNKPLPEENGVKVIKEKRKTKVLKEKGVTESNKLIHTGIGKPTKLHNTEVQASNVKTENKSSDVGNAFKKCFCTAKLKKANYPNPNRVVTVHRAEVIPFFKAFQTCPCPKSDKILTKNKPTRQEMKTLFPYKPDKFYENVSYPLLFHNVNEEKSPDSSKCCSDCNCSCILCQEPKTPFSKSIKIANQNKSLKKCCRNCICKCKYCQKVQINSGCPDGPKRLTAKVTKTSIHASSSKGNKPMWNSLRSAVRCCKYFFSKDDPKKSLSENKCIGRLQEPLGRGNKKRNEWHEHTKSELCAKKNEECKPKKSKSLKIWKITNDHKCLEGCPRPKLKFSHFQAGDNIPLQKTENKGKDLGIHINIHNDVCTGKTEFNVLTAHNTRMERNPDANKKVSPCIPSCTLKYNEKKGNNPPRIDLRGLGDVQQKDFKSNKMDCINSLKTHPTCPRCSESKRDKKNIKGHPTFGDKTSTKKSRRTNNKEETKAEFISPCISEVVYTAQNESKTKQIKRKPDRKPNETNKRYQPLFKKGTCRCCICKKPLQASCDCGSPVCADERQKIAMKQKAEADKKAAELRKKTKPCTCGMAPCAKEIKKTGKVVDHANLAKSKAAKASEKQKHQYKALEKMQKMKKLNQEKLLKIKANEKKKRKKKMYQEYLARQKQYKIEDAIRKKKRAKEDRYNDKQVEKYKDTPDLLLLTESVIDILKLVFIIFSDILRCIFRAFISPKRFADAVRTLRKDPKRIFLMIKRTLSDSGGAAAIRRIKRRFGAMKIVRMFKSKMEQYAVTNYLLHIAAKDPRKRMRRRRPGQGKKGKEPIDFECSPFMGQLRRRPYLIIYYSCPWFYPHCLSMANALKQFLDILLFLLAVFVWCPCILCMEFVRAVTCWIFCTGG